MAMNKREDDLQARRAGVYGAKRPGSFFAFGSDPKTGKIGQAVQGYLAGKGGDRLAGTGIGNEDLTAADIRAGRAGDLATGLRVGASAGTAGVGRAAQSVATRAPQRRVGPIEAATRIDPVNPLGKKLSQREIRGRKNAVAGRTGPTYLRFMKKINEEKEQAAAILAERHAQAVGTLEHERSIKLAQAKQAAMGERQISVEGVKQVGRKELSEMGAEQKSDYLEQKFEQDMEMFGVKQQAEAEGKAGDRAHELTKLAQEYALKAQNSQNKSEIDHAEAMELEAYRAAEKAREKTVRTSLVMGGEKGEEVVGKETTTKFAPAPEAAKESVGDLNGDGRETVADRDFASAQKILSIIGRDFPNMKPAEIELELSRNELKKYRRAIEIMKGI